MIDSVMKLKDGSWFFKRMKVEVRDPSNPRRTVSVSYIDMDSRNSLLVPVPFPTKTFGLFFPGHGGGFLFMPHGWMI